jgi:hypothetical protein
MRKRAAIGCILVLALLAGAGGTRSAAAGPEEGIAWVHKVVEGFEKAAAEQKVLMICINAKDTPGEKMEYAAKALREVIYKDPSVIVKSREFVCVYLTPEGSTDDYGEMRIRFGIEDKIVSPQHIFAAPDHLEGSKPLVRRQYWNYGSGEYAVKAMLDLMDKALIAYRVQQNLPDPPPAEPAGRKAWIGKMLDMVRTNDDAVRLGALRMLVEYDEKNDCTAALVPLVTEFAEADKARPLADVIRVLGVPGLDAAAEAIHPLLAHREDDIRGNAAVTLEYIGCPASAEPLLARAKKEKNEHIANHLYRALGRCAKDDAKVTKRLLKLSTPKKEAFPCYGPGIALGYAARSEKVARSIEKKLAKLGSPFTGFEYGKNTVVRAILMWALSHHGDAKSASFIRKKLMEPLEDEKAWGKGQVMSFYEAVARKCDGQADQDGAIEAGVYGVLWWERGHELLDEYRIGRSVAQFAPKGEWGRKPDEEDG